MEIDIPDLQDLEFEERCSCSHFFFGGAAEYDKRRAIYDQQVSDHRKKTGNYAHPNCTYCKGTGIRPTYVGNRLIEFLSSRYDLIPKEKS